MKDEMLIARWRKAYENYNHQPAPEITYSRGWYRMDISVSHPFRHWKLERLVETLEERARR